MQTQTLPLALNTQELKAARDWIKDCVWGDVDSDSDVDQLSDEQIVRGIKKHYSGGIQAFKDSFEE